MKRRHLVRAACSLFSIFAAAAAIADEAFQLGTVVVSGSRLPPLPAAETVVGQSKLEQYDRDTVGSAAALVPGMNVSHNSRNEDILVVRGFDVREVPVFVDGIPLYVPYDGYVDFEASGREWRTPPLWGIGLTEKISEHSQILYDGRARNLLEAVMWHDGEAAASRARFAALPQKERAAVLHFLSTL